MNTRITITTLVILGLVGNGTLSNGQVTPYCDKNMVRTFGDEPQIHSSCYGGGTGPCSLALYCPPDDQCLTVPPGEGLLSCGTATCHTEACTAWNNGVCKLGRCYKTGQSKQQFPEPPLTKSVKRYNAVQTCEN